MLNDWDKPIASPLGLIPDVLLRPEWRADPARGGEPQPAAGGLLRSTVVLGTRISLPDGFVLGAWRFYAKKLSGCLVD